MAFDKMVLGSFAITNTTLPALSAYLLDSLASQRRLVLFFVNTNFVVKCRELSAGMDSDSVLLVNDGVGMDLAAWLINRRRFKANLNGTDFTPYFLRRHSVLCDFFYWAGRRKWSSALQNMRGNNWAKRSWA